MSRLADGWLDADFGYRVVVNPRTPGGTYDPEGQNYPWRLQLHSIESRLIPNTATFPYPPHLWVSYETGQLIQNVPLTRSAFALYQPPVGSYYTNRARALQVEIAGFADEAGEWSDAKLDWLVANVLVPMCRFVEVSGGRVDLSDQAVPLPGPHTGYGENSPQRLDDARWISGPVGLVGHRHVPGNDHWDTGQLDLRRLRDKLVAVLGGDGHQQPIPTEPIRRTFPLDMHLRRHPPVWDDDLGAFVPGPVIVYPKGSPDAFSIKDSPVIMYDAPLVPAGARAVIAPIDPTLGRFQVVPIVANDGGQLPLTEAGWGAAATTPPLKRDSWVTFVVPERATAERVRAYLVG